MANVCLSLTNNRIPILSHSYSMSKHAMKLLIVEFLNDDPQTATDDAHFFFSALN